MAAPHNVLVLGAGLVSRPIIDFFLEDRDVTLTVATLYVEDAAELVGDAPDAIAVAVDVTDETEVDRLVAGCDLVVSLVPFHLHAKVASAAIERRVPLVTTSYVSPEMRALDAAAQEAGVLLLNECGLDPGLDHMSAMRVIDRVHAAGGKVLEFESCTGGLPAPEAATNPWRYKFSWSPRGALVAGTQAARYLGNGALREVPGERLFEHAWPYDVHGLGRFEVYPNRDSMPYREIYGIPEVETMMRGTIRYPGWAPTMKAVADLGLLKTDARRWPQGATYADLTVASIDGATAGTPRERVAAHLGPAASDELLDRLEWAGLFADEPLGEAEAAPLDLVARHFEQRMRYAPGERDMVVMQHDFGIVNADGTHERQQSQLIVYGDTEGHTATSRTVSWPAAIAAKLVLEGRFELAGVQVPNRAELYGPSLAALEPLGIAFTEQVVAADESD